MKGDKDMFKRLEELENEVEELKIVIREKDNMLGSIYEKSSDYLTRNCVEALAGIRRIKELAALGLDIKKEQIDIDK